MGLIKVFISHCLIQAAMLGKVGCLGEVWACSYLVFSLNLVPIIYLCVKLSSTVQNTSCC